MIPVRCYHLFHTHPLVYSLDYCSNYYCHATAIYFNPQGLSAAFSAPLLASIPVTHRGISNQVVMCTGYGRNNTPPDLIQYHKEQTVVFLMAVGRLRQLCERLRREGRMSRSKDRGWDHGNYCRFGRKV